MIPYIILAIENDEDREFMTELYVKYQALMFSEIYKIVGTPWSAEDVRQSVVEKLIDKIALLRGMNQRGRINYIITASKNSAFNYCRDTKPLFSLDDESNIFDPDDSLENIVFKKEDLQVFSRAWKSLDEKTQYLLSAKYILDKSANEIAEDLGMPSNNVRMALVRAKQKARKAMAALEANQPT